MAGCKCPGSCACKIKKPRKPKVKKAVVGGRVRQPQVVIQVTPPVSTTAIPAGYPYLTVTSDADYTKPFKTKKKKANQIVKEGKKANQREMGTMTAETGRASTLVADAIAETRNKEEPMKELKGESRFLTKPELKTPSQQLSLLKSKIAAGTTKQFPIVRATTGTQAGPSLTTTEVQTEAPTRMTTEAQTNLIEHVGVGTQATKETREMATETEPLLVNVAKGAKQDIFNLMKEQETTGKIVSLTGAGRPARPFYESFALASPSPSPVPVRVAPPVAPPAAPVAPPAVAAALNSLGPNRSTSSMKSLFKKEPSAVPVGSASSSEGVPGYTEVRPRTTEIRTLPTGVPGALYKITRPARVVQMPPEVIDLS